MFDNSGRNLIIIFVIFFMLQYLLSSSADKTVRLWRIGSDHCLRVFPHSNYGEFCVLLINIILA